MPKFLRKEPCPKCGSRDNLARYDDGHAHCFSMNCNHFEPKAPQGAFFIEHERKPTRALELTGIHESIKDRRINKKTCELYNVTVEYSSDGTVSKHHYPYYNEEGQPIATKVRIVEGKQFYVTGTLNESLLFGQKCWKAGGKYITITEGELDALAVAEMFDCKFPVVSLKTGAKGAKKDLQGALEYLESFDNVVLCFDNDEAGKQAVKEVVDLFSPNKCKVMTLPLKDAGDMLKQNKVREFTQAFWNAQTYKPDGIVSGLDTWDLITEHESVVSTPYPWSGLNEFTKGFRFKELVTITSGSGMGKSQVTRELSHYLLKNTEENIGILALEEDITKTALGIMSIEANRPLHVDTSVSMEDKKKHWENTLGTGRFFLLDHWGSTQEENLLSRIRYLAKGLDCKYIILDHLSIVVSDQEQSDERKAIDSIMTKLRSLVQETGIGLFLVSHLKRPHGPKGHEEGHKVSLADLRGSAAIAQLSDIVIGLERNQQHEDVNIRNTTTVRVLKNRFVGLTGSCCYLQYDADTGRMTEVSEPEEYKGDDF